MSEHIYKHIEITGSSTEGSDQAVRNAVAKAARTIHHMDWYKITESRGLLQEGKVAFWQVTITIGFRLDD